MSEKKQKVLVICRSAAGQMYLGVLMNRMWYAPILARTPEDGVRLAQETPFSIILLDGDISEFTLRPVVSILRTEPSLKDLPLVVFTTNDNPSVSEALLSQGCAAVLSKPIDLSMLYGVLQRLSGQPRATPRIVVKFPVAIKEGSAEKSLTCTSLSEGGMYLRTYEPLPEGTVIQVKFNLPLDPEAIELSVEVVRTLPLSVQLEADPGMGLRFVDTTEGVLAKVRNFVQWEMAGDLEWKSNL
jgi:CheY-like chemotaxis protein